MTKRENTLVVASLMLMLTALPVGHLDGQTTGSWTSLTDSIASYEQSLSKVVLDLGNWLASQYESGGSPPELAGSASTAATDIWSAVWWLVQLNAVYAGPTSANGIQTHAYAEALEGAEGRLSQLQTLAEVNLSLAEVPGAVPSEVADQLRNASTSLDRVIALLGRLRELESLGGDFSLPPPCPCGRFGGP